MIRIYSIGNQGRFRGVLFLLLALGIGTMVLFFGLLLLAGVAAIGTVIGAGIALSRRLRGNKARPDAVVYDPTLDPRLQVFPDRAQLGAGSPDDVDRG